MTRARPERFIRDAHDLCTCVAKPACSCKCGKRKDAALSKEHALTEGLRARMRDMWRDVPGSGDES